MEAKKGKRNWISLAPMYPSGYGYLQVTVNTKNVDSIKSALATIEPGDKVTVFFNDDYTDTKAGDPEKICAQLKVGKIAGSDNFAQKNTSGPLPGNTEDVPF